MFKIIAEYQDFIIVDKGAGINFHDEGVLGTGLHSQVKAQLNQYGATDELYPVHRLDKMTSGLLIFAKTLACAKIFGLLFEQHKIEKYYLALSDKKPIKKQGLIQGDMAKSRRGMFKLLRTTVNPAVTQFYSYHIDNKQRLFLLKPHSGKTHQLRVALSSLGSPITGDPLYYSQSNADRGYLHAYALRFTYQGSSFEFNTAPHEGHYFVSVAMKERLLTLKKPWQLNWPRL